MHAVGEFMALHPQRRRHGPDRIQASTQAHHIGAVAEDDHGTEALSAAVHLAGVQVKHPAADHDPVASLALLQGADDVLRQIQVPQRHPLQLHPPEHLLRLVVGDPDDTRFVEGDDAVTHSVEHRRLVLHQDHQLLRLDPQGQLLPAAPQHKGRPDADQQGRCGGRTDAEQQLRQVVEDARPLETHADLTDRFPGARREDRYLGPDGIAQRAPLPGDDLLAAEGRLEARAHLAVELPRVRVRHTDPLAVGDDDEQCTRPAGDVPGIGLEGAVGEFGRGGVDPPAGLPGHLGTHDGGRGHGARNREGRGLGLVLELFNPQHDEDAGARGHHRHDGHQLQKQHPGAESHLPAPACRRRPPRPLPTGPSRESLVRGEPIPAQAVRPGQTSDHNAQKCLNAQYSGQCAQLYASERDHFRLLPAFQPTHPEPRNQESGCTLPQTCCSPRNTR